MKLGAENPKWTVGAIALFAVAIVLFLRMILGMMSGGTAPAPAASKAKNGTLVPSVPTAQSGTPRPAPRRPARRNGRPQPEGETSFLASLDPRLRTDLLATAEQTTYTGSGRNIFRLEAEPIPEPVAPVMKPPEVTRTEPQGPPPTPPPPPINLRFFGFATSEGEPKRVFLVSGEDVFIAGEGDIVNRRYKVIRIGTSSVEVEDLLSNRRQSLPLAG
ncbi:MAG: hypothetical protein AB7O65_11055 [Candidatus Korobacteraceae bacterium]